MEFFAHQKAFAFLLGTGMIIKSFISDRHLSIAKWMRQECPKKCQELGKPVIHHFFDLWHIGKSNEFKILLYTLNISFDLNLHWSHALGCTFLNSDYH